MILDNNILSKNGILIVETKQVINVEKYRVLDIKTLKNKAQFYFLSLK